MKRLLTIVMCSALCLLFCSCGISGVTKEQYEALLAEKNALQAELNEMKTDVPVAVNDSSLIDIIEDEPSTVEKYADVIEWLEAEEYDSVKSDWSISEALY